MGWQTKEMPVRLSFRNSLNPFITKRVSYTPVGRDQTQQTENFMSGTAIGILQANPYFIYLISKL
jgi:hypothetical protein